MNIFKRELKANRNSTIIWAVSFAILITLFLMLYPAFTKDVDITRKILANLPLIVSSALGVSLANFFTIYGFFAYLFTPAVIPGAIQAMSLGVGMLSKEESGKTVDFLLSKPISRGRVVTEKLLAALCLLIFTNIVFSSVALAMASLVSTTSFSSTTFLLITATLLFIQIFFLALGMLFSVIMPKVKSVIAVALPTVFSFFIIGTLGAILGNDAIKYLSPFKYFDPNYIIANRAYEPKYLIIEAIIVFIAITVSYVIYIRKDIRAVS